MSAADDRAALESELLRQRIRLYLYGELGLAERKEVERFRDEMPEFRALFEEEQAFLLSLSDSDVDAEVESLLDDCRHDLALAVAAEGSLGRASSLWRRLGRRLRSVGSALAARPLVWQPAAAAVLVVVGFVAGRDVRSVRFLAPEPVDGASLIESFSLDANRTLTGIETVQLDPVGGQVRIVLEERRVVSGESSDPLIRGMLMDTVRESHAGARLSSLEALQGHASDREVRRILLRSMLEDQNPGIRLQALEAVRGQVDEPDVRAALVETLRSDPLDGMRIHAIQLLGQRPGRELVGALQELVEREQNPFVLHESERILDVLDASMERF